jgi:hypothetical protein
MFARAANSERQIEAKLQSIRVGEIQPDTLTVVRKYVNPGKAGLPHVIFSSNRHQKVDISATRDFFNTLKLGDAIPGYYFPDGFFIPQNYRADAGVGKWFFPALGVLLGGGTLAFAFTRARTRPPYGDIEAFRTITRDRIERH